VPVGFRYSDCLGRTHRNSIDQLAEAPSPRAAGPFQRLVAGWVQVKGHLAAGIRWGANQCPGWPWKNTPWDHLGKHRNPPLGWPESAPRSAASPRLGALEMARGTVRVSIGVALLI
jgi:hypothetical protein